MGTCGRRSEISMMVGCEEKRRRYSAWVAADCREGLSCFCTTKMTHFSRFHFQFYFRCSFQCRETTKASKERGSNQASLCAIWFVRRFCLELLCRLTDVWIRFTLFQQWTTQELLMSRRQSLRNARLYTLSFFLVLVIVMHFSGGTTRKRNRAIT